MRIGHMVVAAAIPIAVCASDVPSLQAVKISATHGALQITLANRAHQPLLGYCMKSRTASLILQEFVLPQSAGVPAGSSFDTTLSIDPSLPDPQTEVSSFSVTCALFEDGTTEGSGSDLAMLNQLRTGRLLQTTRLLPILDGIRRTSDAQFGDAVRRAISQIIALDTTLEDGTRSQGLLANGIRNTNTLFVQALRSILQQQRDAGPTAGRAQLDAVLAGYVRARDQLVRTRMKE